MSGALGKACEPLAAAIDIAVREPPDPERRLLEVYQPLHRSHSIKMFCSPALASLAMPAREPRQAPADTPPRCSAWSLTAEGTAGAGLSAPRTSPASEAAPELLELELDRTEGRGFGARRPSVVAETPPPCTLAIRQCKKG